MPEPWGDVSSIGVLGNSEPKVPVLQWHEWVSIITSYTQIPEGQTFGYTLTNDGLCNEQWWILGRQDARKLSLSTMLSLWHQCSFRSTLYPILLKSSQTEYRALESKSTEVNILFDIRYTISSLPQTRFRSFHATSLECRPECRLRRRVNRIAYTEFRYSIAAL